MKIYPLRSKNKQNNPHFIKNFPKVVLDFLKKEKFFQDVSNVTPFLSLVGGESIKLVEIINIGNTFYTNFGAFFTIFNPTISLLLLIPTHQMFFAEKSECTMRFAKMVSDLHNSPLFITCENPISSQ